LSITSGSVREELAMATPFVQAGGACFDELGGGRFRVQERVKSLDRLTQTRLVDRKFAPVLAPDGFLFIGKSESLLGGSQRFKYAQLRRCPMRKPICAPWIRRSAVGNPKRLIEEIKKGYIV
jgi:hypothetical protein